MSIPDKLKAKICKTVDIERTPRVMQMEGIFDVPPSERSEEFWEVSIDLPDEWNIGLIVGPSGSGKTTIAQELLSDYLVGEFSWPDDLSILEAFPKQMSVKDIVALLSSVGFSSPPSWVRPYKVLSNGEQFRVTMARILAESPDLAVVDEFTSVVDRTVAQIGSSAIQKTVRRMNKKLIALSCHYDIINWIEPDWVYQPHTNEFYSGRYLHQRPSINVKVRRVHHSAWAVFRKFHYLDQNLNKAAHCFVAYIIDDQTKEEIPAAFCAVISFPHAHRPGWRIHRLVCLPDYQGIGLGTALGDYTGSIFRNTGKPFFITLSHPALIHSYMKSEQWKTIRKGTLNSRVGKSGLKEMNKTVATKRLTYSFEYVGPVLNEDVSMSLLKGL